MKKKGSTIEFSSQRNKELICAFKSQLHLLGSVNPEELFARAAMMPSSRFWVSESRAAVVMGKMMKGDRLEKMNPKKREMFSEIYSRVMKEMKEDKAISIKEASFRAVNSPAPEFYLTPKSARVIIYKLRG